MARTWLLGLSLLLPLSGCGTARVASTAQVQAPVKTSGAAPIYPESLAEQGLQGFVIVEATVSREGKVKRSRVLTSSDPRFEGPALEAVNQWQFEPATHRGRPVEVIYTLTVNVEAPPEESSPSAGDR